MKRPEPHYSGAMEEKIKQLESQIKELRDSLSDVMGLIDSGDLIRDTSKDHEPDYTQRMLVLVGKLKVATDLLTKTK